MSTSLTDISYDLANGIFTVLNGNVTYGGTTYPVYKSVPKTPAVTYVLIGDILQGEDGTKDSFDYYGTVQVIVVDESIERAGRKKAQGILGVVRGLLKATKSTVFSCGDRTLVIFSHESLVPLTEMADAGISRIRLVDIYNFYME